MGKLIRVQAKREHRRELARWGRGIRGVRTVSSTELGFPPHVFPDIPEHLLVDALIDGRPYHLARHVPAPQPRAKRKEAPGAASAGNRAQGQAADAVASRAVADPADVVEPGAVATAVPPATLSPAATTPPVAGRDTVATTSAPAVPAAPEHTTPPAAVPAAPVTTGTASAAPADATVAGAGAPTLAPQLGRLPLPAAGSPAPQTTEPGSAGRSRRRGAVACQEPGCGFSAATEHGLRVHHGKTGHGPAPGGPT